MTLFIRRMNENAAAQILQWKYQPPYDFYNDELNDEAVKEMVGNPYFIVLDENDHLVGFFCIGYSAIVPKGRDCGAYSEELIDIGIGMKPELTGQGLGHTFFSFILAHVQRKFEEVPIRLTVATFNQRAIHLYEKLGFVKRLAFNHGAKEFITMVKES